MYEITVLILIGVKEYKEKAGRDEGRGSSKARRLKIANSAISYYEIQEYWKQIKCPIRSLALSVGII